MANEVTVGYVNSIRVHNEETADKRKKAKKTMTISFSNGQTATWDDKNNNGVYDGVHELVFKDNNGKEINNKVLLSQNDKELFQNIENKTIDGIMNYFEDPQTHKNDDPALDGLRQRTAAHLAKVNNAKAMQQQQLMLQQSLAKQQYLMSSTLNAMQTLNPLNGIAQMFAQNGLTTAALLTPNPSVFNNMFGGFGGFGGGFSGFNGFGFGQGMANGIFGGLGFGGGFGSLSGASMPYMPGMPNTTLNSDYINSLNKEGAEIENALHAKGMTLNDLFNPNYKPKAKLAFEIVKGEQEAKSSKSVEKTAAPAASNNDEIRVVKQEDGSLILDDKYIVKEDEDGFEITDKEGNNIGYDIKETTDDEITIMLKDGSGNSLTFARSALPNYSGNITQSVETPTTGVAFTAHATAKAEHEAESAADATAEAPAAAPDTATTAPAQIKNLGTIQRELLKANTDEERLNILKNLKDEEFLNMFNSDKYTEIFMDIFYDGIDDRASLGYIELRLNKIRYEKGLTRLQTKNVTYRDMERMDREINNLNTLTPQQLKAAHEEYTGLYFESSQLKFMKRLREGLYEENAN